MAVIEVEHLVKQFQSVKKEKGLIIGLMAFFLVSGGAACIVRQYRDGQENVPAPVYVYQDRQLPQTTKEPESEPEKVPVQEEPVKVSPETTRYPAMRRQASGQETLRNVKNPKY